MEIAPGNLSKVLFAPSGSDAIEMALAYARAATGRFKTISFWDSFHGAGFGATASGARRCSGAGPSAPCWPEPSMYLRLATIATLGA